MFDKQDYKSVLGNLKKSDIKGLGDDIDTPAHLTLKRGTVGEGIFGKKIRDYKFFEGHKMSLFHETAASLFCVIMGKESLFGYHVENRLIYSEFIENKQGIEQAKGQSFQQPAYKVVEGTVKTQFQFVKDLPKIKR